MLVLTLYAEDDAKKNKQGIDPGSLLYLRLADGRDIEIVCIESERGRCRVGVRAPLDVKVERYLYRKMRSQPKRDDNAEASNNDQGQEYTNLPPGWYIPPATEGT